MNLPAKYLAETAMVADLLATRPLLRTVNYHNTPATRRAELDEQLAACARHYASVNEADLDRYLSTGEWHHEKPGILLAFYEGYRNGYDVVRPLLEKHGLTGWFLVISGFIDTPVSSQYEYARRHVIEMKTEEYPDGRYALSWDEIRELDERHVVACHGRSHLPIAPMAAEEQHAEVVGSQRRFVEELGHPVRSFVARGGPAFGDDPALDRLVDEAGFQFMISGYRVQRLREDPPMASAAGDQ